MREPQRDAKIGVEGPFYASLGSFLQWWAGEIGKRAEHAALKAAPALTQESDLERLLRIVTTYLDRAAALGVEGAVLGLNDLFGFSFDPMGANTQAAKWARKHAAQLVGNIGSNTEKRIAAAVANYIQSDQTIGELQRTIDKAVHDMSRAAMIAQTETTRAFATANSITWKESGIVEGKQWNTNNDELVCKICQPLNGKIIPLDGSFGFNVFEEDMTEPPAHPNCRCWVTPVSKMRRK